MTYHDVSTQHVNGLSDGTTYTIRPLAGQTGEYQLRDVSSGLVVPISVDSTYGAIPYLTTTTGGASVNLPIVDLDDGLNALVYNTSIPGISATTQSVVYHAALGQAIAGLEDGKTYTMKETSTKGSYQLFDASSNRALVFSNPMFTGLGQNLPAALDAAAHTVKFNFQTGFTSSSEIIYRGATDQNRRTWPSPD